LLINESVAQFGKRLRAKTNPGSGSGGVAKKWTDGTTTITSTQLLALLYESNPDVVKMLPGTEKASAHSRVIESAQRRGYLTGWQVVE